MDTCPLISWHLELLATLGFHIAQKCLSGKCFIYSCTRSLLEFSNQKINYEVHDWNPMCDDVVLDAYNCNLTMIVKHSCFRGESMIENGLCSL